MKVVILAGGFGSRLGEETETRPKPMVEIGERPILWHIMMHYYHFGHRDFAVAVGYKGEYIKRWFKDFSSLEGPVTINTRTGQVEGKDVLRPDWSVHLLDTGLRTRTGGRIKQMHHWVDGTTFMLTWGDGLSDVNIDRLLEFHRSHGRLATVTAVRPPARYGHLEFDGDRVASFSEKPQTSEGWINGGYFVLEPGVFDYIEGDVMWEHEPMERLAADGQLMAYKHDSFWQCMDTLREKQLLEHIWQSGNAPWKNWSDE